MNGISISLVQLLFKGVPEGFLMTLSFHLFTNTKIEWKKLTGLAFINIIITYIIRFLPINIGVNTILSLLALIISFNITYKAQLDVVVRSIITAFAVMTMVVISETINYLLLHLWFGRDKTYELLGGTSELVKSLATVPSTLLLAAFIFLAYGVMKHFENRKATHGKSQ